MEYWLSLRLGVSRERLNRVYYQKYNGVEESELVSLIAGWYEQQSKNDRFYIVPTVTRFNRHKERGLKTVLVSGSFELLLGPIIDQLGADYCLATRLESKNGVLTGKIIPPQTIGAGKSLAIQEFVKKYSVDLKLSYAYGDHHSDIPMLQQVGIPVAVAPDPVLLNYAIDQRWQVI
jgi:HAD superfamily hydrolase (TIGR01490 family)